MERQITTTSFGRRPAKLCQIANRMNIARLVEDAGKPGSNAPAAVNKWTLFRTLTEIKDRLGVSDRALGVLNALLSFQQETALSLPKVLLETEAADVEEEGQGTSTRGASCDLVVFPSNKALCLRAHGMEDRTLRRHIAILVDAGLIIRRDSPNGKRYARKDQTGQERFSDAFGFDLTPLVARAAEFNSMAEQLRRDKREVMLLKERISLHRRDISKLVACGLDEGLPGDWEGFRQRFMGLVTPLRRIKETGDLRQLECELAELHAAVTFTIESIINAQNMSGNDGDFGQHQSNSNHLITSDSEPTSKAEGEQIQSSALPDPVQNVSQRDYTIGMVIEACPDVSDYHTDGGKIRTWPQFMTAARLLRPMLGISPDAWRDAISVMGEVDAAIVVATILQRSEHSSEAKTLVSEGSGTIGTVVNGSPAIKSPGGYLRALTEKARAGEFALGPILMALMGQRLKAKRAVV